MRDLDAYPFEISTLSEDDGGGYLITYPDFNVCISDGETIEEAIANGRDALRAVIETLEGLGRPVPEPGSGGGYSGRFVQRIPKSLHAQLVARARREGVSMNALVATMLAEALGRRGSARDDPGQ